MRRDAGVRGRLMATRKRACEAGDIQDGFGNTVCMSQRSRPSARALTRRRVPMNEGELQRARKAVAQLAELRSKGNHAEGRRLGEELLAQLGDQPPAEAQPMLCDALALTGDALYGLGRTEEADALWADLIGRFAGWSRWRR